MSKLFGYILTVPYYLVYGLWLVLFHGIQWLALKLGGYQAHKISVDILNLFLVRTLWFLGSHVTIRNKQTIPTDRPLIIVSNHQGLNDISPLGWAFRKHHPKYVSKIELGKGIPSVSFNLNHGGSVLIDRKDAKQSLRAIIGLGKYIEEHNRSAVIFPEGTRSRNGVPKRFSENGVKMLVRSAPSALIVPVTINNSWKLTRYGNFPLGTGVHLTLDVHEPIDPTTMSFEDMMTTMEETIKRAVI